MKRSKFERKRAKEELNVEGKTFQQYSIVPNIAILVMIDWLAALGRWEQEVYRKEITREREEKMRQRWSKADGEQGMTENVPTNDIERSMPEKKD